MPVVVWCALVYFWTLRFSRIGDFYTLRLGFFGNLDLRIIEAYKDFIYQTMVECQTGQDRLVAPLLGKGVTVGHKTGTGDFNAKGQQIGCNDIGFVLLPNGHAYSIAVFVKDSAESSLENSKIIADISRIVYEYAMQSAKLRE